jgi:uncharacterized membrane protein
MQYLHLGAFYFHVALGFIALILFWIPIATKKGAQQHIKFGKWYSYCMYTIAILGMFMTSLVLLDPFGVKSEEAARYSSPEQFVDSAQRLSLFLLFLSVLTFASIHQGMRVVKFKRAHNELRKPLHLLPLFVLLILSLVLTVLAIKSGILLHGIFGVLGFFISAGMLKYCFGRPSSPKAYIGEHLGGMIGSGIGAYTAFLAFGGRVMFSDMGQYQILFWVAPGIIGGTAISLLVRKYKGGTKTAKS